MGLGIVISMLGNKCDNAIKNINWVVIVMVVVYVMRCSATGSFWFKWPPQAHIADVGQNRARHYDPI